MEFRKKIKLLAVIIILTILMTFSYSCKKDTLSLYDEGTGHYTGKYFKDSVLVKNCDYIEPSPEESSRHYRTTYDFSSDWFTPNIPAWRGALGHLRGKPKVHYLEVGLYEGRSAIWVLENILTDPTAHLTGIDIFPGNIEKRWLTNLERTGKKKQATTIKGYSQKVLLQLPNESFDIIYIDGSHTGYDVLADAILAWGLLKPGGVMIFDDYRWRRGHDLPPELKPGPAIDAFVSMYRDFIVIIHRCYQLMLMKRQNPCMGKEYCSLFGQYIFLWNKGHLLNPRGLVPISDEERDFIRILFHARRYGQSDFTVPSQLLESIEFKAFVNRLQLEFLLPVPPEIQRLREIYGPVRYSRGNEELLVRDYFKEMWDGIFVDIGGGKFWERSHTLFLERHLGWKGIVVDTPNRLDAKYQAIRLNSKIYDNLTDILSNSTNLAELLVQEKFDHIDFLNISLAEAKLKALENIDIKRFKPQLICISVQDTVKKQVEQYFCENDYILLEDFTKNDSDNQYYRPKN